MNYNQALCDVAKPSNEFISLFYLVSSLES